MEVSEINEGSMIECKKHKAIIPPSTCVARHKGLAKAKKSNNGWIKANALNYEDCRGCKIGLKLYEKYLKGEKIMKEKVCSKCHTPKPADKNIFTVIKIQKTACMYGARIAIINHLVKPQRILRKTVRR
uniref:Uncharacterized protein n=1 Tax=uncultured marine virus TaxID=186617 RepID=A0A0F7L4Y0_9VIRU|nr:hypothetical protein [uncultured marine virus]